MTFLIILTTLLVFAAASLGVLFFYLNKRQEKIIERQTTFVGWCETLMENQETLTKDMAKLHHEIKSIQDGRKL